jgi:ABC-type multidrug transport system ATPase subunit
MIDRIIKGEERGHYYLLLGPKGSGKTSMMIQSVGSAR